MTDATTHEDQVALGDKTVELAQYDRYKGVKDRTDRIAILSSTLMRGWRCYYAPKKRSFRAPTNKELLDKVTALLGPPEQRFALTVFQYLTDDDGNLLDETKCQGKVKIWVVSESRYGELSALAKEWPLMDAGQTAVQHDLKIKCTEEQYQRMIFSATKTAHWKTKLPWYVALKAKEVAAGPKLKLALGKRLPDHEIMEILGTAPSTPPTGGPRTSADIDLGDVLDDA